MFTPPIPPYFIKLCYLAFFGCITTLYGCRQKVMRDGCDSWAAFATQKKYKGDYTRSLPLGSPDSIISRLKADLPPEWCNKAIESVYYRLPAATPDSVLLQYFAKFDAAFANDSVRAFTQMIRGHISMEHAQYDSARYFLHDSYALSLKDHRLLRASDAKLDLAEILVEEGNYPEGIRMQLECYSLREPLHLHDGSIEEVMFALGRSYRFYENHAAALQWDRQVWALTSVNDENKNVRTRAATSMARDYLCLRQLDSAKTMIDSAFALAEANKIEAYSNLRYFIRAEIKQALGNCQAAIGDYWYAKNERLYSEDPRFVSKFNQGLANNYGCLGKPDSAIFFYKEALNTPDTVSQIKIYAQLAKIYEQQQNFAQALYHERRSKELKSRMVTMEKERALERVKVTKENQARIDTADNGRKKAGFWLLGISIVAFIALVVGFFIVRQLRNKQRQLQKEKATAIVRAKQQTQALSVAETTMATQAAELLDLKTALLRNLQLKTANAPTDPAQADSLQPTNAPTQPTAPDETFNDLRLLTGEEWLSFRQQFDQRFPAFNTKLKTLFPSMSSGDTRLFLLLKIGFDNTQIANTLGISAASVYKNRYRLRKKLGIADDTVNLEDYIQAF